ncbi:MAG: hypothetical protein ACW981_18990 [Candidatus Hodarchaeales archaeon]|jgi:signal peptidase I
MIKIDSNLIFSTIIISILVLISGFLIIGPYSLTSVSTNSMEPTHEGYLTKNNEFNFFKGDLLILENKNAEIGDIILFKSPTSEDLFLHRAIASKISDNKVFYGTKGDNNNFTDLFTFNPDTHTIPADEIINLGWIPEENVIGVAVVSIPLLGGLLNSIFHPIGFSIIFILVFLSFFIYTNRNEINNNNNIKNIRKKYQSLGFSVKTGKSKIKLRNNAILTILILTILIASFFLVNIGFFLTNTNNVTLLTREGEELPETIKLTDIHSFARENHEVDGKEIFLYNTRLLVSSRGFLNTIKEVSITIHYIDGINENYAKNILNYSKYSFLDYFGGSKVINSILIFIDPFSINSTREAEIIISVTNTGLFAEKSFEKQYNITLS